MLEKDPETGIQGTGSFFRHAVLDHAYSSRETSEVVGIAQGLGITGLHPGTSGLFPHGQELIDHLVRRPLIRPLEVKYSVEDDDTGEPLRLAEDATASRAHVQHIKSLAAIIASNPA